MAVTSVVQLSELDDSTRIDAEHYDPRCIAIERKVLATNTCHSWKQLDGQFITGPFGSEFNVENYVTDSPHRYVRGKDVKEFFLLDEDNVYIPKKDFERLKEYALFEGDILVSVVGTLGNAVVVDKTVPPAIFSCKSTAFRSKAVNPFYLITYLNCKFGKTLLQRRVRGAAQTGLNIGDLKSLPVFLPEKGVQDQIGRIVLEAQASFEMSKSLYRQAEKQLLQEVGLNDFKPSYKGSYVTSLLRAFNRHRVDAEYFQPAYAELIQELEKSVELRPLGSLVSGIRKGIEIGAQNYLEEGKLFIRVSNLSVHGFAERDQKYMSDEVYQQLKGNYQPTNRDFLLTKDATPGIAYVVKENIEGIISSGIVKLLVDEN